MKRMKNYLKIIYPFLFFAQSVLAQEVTPTSQNQNDEWGLNRVMDPFPSTHVKEWEQMHNSKQAAMDWFTEAKYGMFIHFGPYSTSASKPCFAKSSPRRWA